MINVLADKYLYRIEELMPEGVDLTLYDPGAPIHSIPDGTDALLTRTVTKINRQVFPRLPDRLAFVGTGSAGTDHVDEAYLEAQNIAFASAAGCNARSVAEYVAVALLLWAGQQQVELTDYRLGIVGVGHAGGEVQQLMKRLGVEVRAYDPPRGLRDEGFISADLEEVLACDILTFHVPLKHQGDHATYHWLDDAKLGDRSFALVVNASRGGVVDEAALVRALKEGTIGNAVVDVWENEPDFDDALARRALLKTPHIAGYSRQAKTRATRMIVDAMAEHFNIASGKRSQRADAAPRSPVPPSTFWSLADVLTFYHPVRDYETRLLMLVGRDSPDKMRGFNEIRSNHPLRNEFHTLEIPVKLADRYPELPALGFRLPS